MSWGSSNHINLAQDGLGREIDSRSSWELEKKWWSFGAFLFQLRQNCWHGCGIAGHWWCVLWHEGGLFLISSSFFFLLLFSWLSLMCTWKNERERVGETREGRRPSGVMCVGGMTCGPKWGEEETLHMVHGLYRIVTCVASDRSMRRCVV